jgi:hypothetical protein
MNTANPFFFILLVVIGVSLAVLVLPPFGKFEIKAVPGY